MNRLALRTILWMMAAFVLIFAVGRIYIEAEGRRIQTETVHTMLQMGLGDFLARLEAAPPSARPQMLSELPLQLREEAEILPIEALPSTLSRVEIEDRPVWVDRGTAWAQIDAHQLIRIRALTPPRPSFLLFFVVIAVTVIASLGIALPLVRRLAHLTAASREVAGGNLGVRVNDDGRDAIGALAQQFDAMTATLEHQSREQRAFLNGVTHELATPLARLEFAMELLENAGEQDREQRMASIRRELTELGALADEILEWAGQEAELDLQTIDLALLLRDLIDRRPTAHEVVLTGSAWIRGDVRSVERALDNVYRNALTYAERRVHLRIVPSKGGVEVWIEDDGPGIPATQRTRVFEPFARADSSRDRETGGTGLGLSIVARILERHGGSVEATRSTTLGGAALRLCWLS